MNIDENMLERVSRERRFDARTVDIARHLFLLNMPPRQVATQFGVVDKRVYAIRAAVLEQVEKYKLPEGWSEITLRGPIDAVKEAEAIFRRRLREIEVRNGAG